MANHSDAKTSGPSSTEAAKDELDPELMSLRRTRPPVGAITSAAIVLFCVFMMLKLRSDLAFSRHSAAPRDVTAAELLDGRVDENELIRAKLLPDRTVAVLVRASESDYGLRATPVQHSDGKLWLMVDGSVWGKEVAYDEVYVGRVRRMRDIPFFDELKAELRTRGATPRFFTSEALSQTLGDKMGASIASPSGESVAVTAAQTVELEVEDHSRATILVVATDRHRTPEAWHKALLEAELITADATALPLGEGSWSFAVVGEDAVAKTAEKLEMLRLLSARVVPVVETVSSTLGAMSVRDGALVVGSRTILPSESPWVNLPMPRTVRADALLIDTTDLPSKYWYILPLFGLLALFALLFSWALVRALLAERHPTGVPASAALR